MKTDAHLSMPEPSSDAKNRTDSTMEVDNAKNRADSTMKVDNGIDEDEDDEVIPVPSFGEDKQKTE